MELDMCGMVGIIMLSVRQDRKNGIKEPLMSGYKASIHSRSGRIHPRFPCLVFGDPASGDISLVDAGLTGKGAYKAAFHHEAGSGLRT
jgi:hypothetical protein